MAKPDFGPDRLHGYLSARSTPMGGNRVQLLQGGDELFPAMTAAMAQARREVWLATYIFDDDGAGRAVSDALVAAARRGVAVRVVVDGFGAYGTLATLRRWLAGSGVQLEVFRPIERWWSWLLPGQLRRLHQKLCVVDDAVAFIGGINIIDDRHDIKHGWTQAPRLDFAVAVQGPLVASVSGTVQAMWVRARLGHRWPDEVKALAASRSPVDEARQLIRRLRGRGGQAPPPPPLLPVVASFIVRDNVHRRDIERAYVGAIRSARQRIDLAVPYFYPGRAFRRSLRQAAKRGVRVRLLMQGMVDYRIAALAARVLYDELRANGVRIYEYTPAFLHAKVALVDDRWATVGSSNIDPLSLLLNLEANVVVRDADFTATLAERLDAAFAASTEVLGAPARQGLRGWLRRGLVAWLATLYLRLAGITGRY